jgi:Carboxypeptidase regulatory-like domain
MKLSALATVAAVAALTSGCIGSSSSSSPGAGTDAAPTSGTVVGLVAVERSPTRLGENPAHLHPLADTQVLITGRTTAGARVVRRSRTDAHGDFRLRLPAGRYVVAAKVEPFAPRFRHRVVVVRPGQVTTVWIARYLTTYLL